MIDQAKEHEKHLIEKDSEINQLKMDLDEAEHKDKEQQEIIGQL